VSPPMVGAGTTRTSSAAANGVLDDVTVVEAMVAAGGSPAPLPADACCWEPDSPAGMISGGGGTPLGAEGEEALANKDGLRPVSMITTLAKTRMGLHLLGALDLSATLEAGRPLLLLLLLLLWLLLLLPLGEITPGGGGGGGGGGSDGGGGGGLTRCHTRF
jgi:hypothetical protein